MTIGLPTVGAKDEHTTASTTSTPGYPASISANDLLLGFGVSGATANNVFNTTGTGFTSDGQDSSIGDTAAPSAFCAHKIATGSESGTQSWPHTNVITSMCIVDVPGVDPTTPFDIVSVPVLIDPGTAATNFTIPSVTPVTNGVTLLYVLSGNSTSITATPPAGWTELVDRTTASARGWQIAYKQNVSAGATGTATGSWSGSNRPVGFLYVLRPAAGGSSASGSASLDLAANGAGAGDQTATASLDLAATGTDAATETGTATLTLAASGASAAPSAGSASLTLGATGSTGGSSPASGTAAVSLVATGADRASSSGGAALTLVASGTDRAAGSASAVLSLVAAGTIVARGAGTAVLSLLGSAAAVVRASGQAFLSLLGVGSASGSGAVVLDPFPQHILYVPARQPVHAVATAGRVHSVPARNRVYVVPPRGQEVT